MGRPGGKWGRSWLAMLLHIPGHRPGASLAGLPDGATAGGRKCQNMSLEAEREFVAPFLEQAATGGVLVVGQIKAALDQRLEREVAGASLSLQPAAPPRLEKDRPRKAPSEKRSTSLG